MRIAKRDDVRNIFGLVVILAIALLPTSACETPASNAPTPTEAPILVTPAPTSGIGISWDEIQAALREYPFEFVFDPPYQLIDGREKVLGYSFEEGAEGVIELIGPPSNLTQITLKTPITGEYARIGLLRLSEVAFHVMPQRERRQGIDVWIGDHAMRAIEDGSQSTQHDDVCMEMIWLEDSLWMTLVVERCDA